MNKNPNHYHYSGLDPDTVAKKWTAHLDPYSACMMYQILKYICRYKFKGGAESLSKARDFLGLLIEHTAELEGKEKVIANPNTASVWERIAKAV